VVLGRDRCAACDEGLAVDASRREHDRRVKKLCRAKVEDVVEPVPWRPRRSGRKHLRALTSKLVEKIVDIVSDGNDTG
jgi:hypothetical protein